MRFLLKTNEKEAQTSRDRGASSFNKTSSLSKQDRLDISFGVIGGVVFTGLFVLVTLIISKHKRGSGSGDSAKVCTTKLETVIVLSYQKQFSHAQT